MMNTYSPIGIDFSEFFDSEEETISQEKIQNLLDQVMAIASEQARLSPQELVRVMHGGRITWMTRQQAAEFLKQTINEDTREAVEQALRGKLGPIRRELEILLAIARYTLHQYKKTRALPPEEVQRLEPALQHRERELRDDLAQTGEYELRLEQKRQAYPFLGQYERLATQLQEEQAKGNLQRARELAKELALKKKLYFLACRSLEPERHALNIQRLNLQKTKKKLIGAQTEICASRQNVLRGELEQLQQQLHSLQGPLPSSFPRENVRKASSAASPGGMNLDEIQHQITQRQNQLAALQQEGEVLQFQERQMDSLIQTITEQVKQESPDREPVPPAPPAPPVSSKLAYPKEAGPSGSKTPGSS